MSYATSPALPPGGSATFHPSLEREMTFGAHLSATVGHGGAQRVRIKVNGNQLFDETVGENGRWVRLPLSPRANGTLELTIETDTGALVAAPTLYIPEDRPRRVVMVVIDTLRADHLGSYGYPRPTSPTIDSLAAEGVRFSQTLAPAPWTLPSTRALLTGAHPHKWGTLRTLATRFREAGWATAAYTRNPWLNHDNGVSTGFGVHDGQGAADAKITTTRALRWLNTMPDRSTFLLLHHMDPHLPYGPPGGIPPELAGVPLPQHDLHPSQLDQIANYDADIRYTDDAIAELIAGLKTLPGETLLVLTSDHGEEFWDHGGREHGHSLHGELLHVPLILHGPGVPKGRVDARPSSLLDVTPTILQWAGMAPDSAIEGNDLLADPVIAPPPVYLADTITGPEAVGVALMGARYWLSGAKAHLYAADDMADATNLADQSDRVAPMQAALARWFDTRVKPGYILHLPGTVRRHLPDLTDVTVDWRTPITDTQIGRGDGWNMALGGSVTLSGTTTTLHLPDAELVSLTVASDAPPPKRVDLTIGNLDTVSAPLRHDRRMRIEVPGEGTVGVLLASGPTAWGGPGAPTASALVVPGGDMRQMLEALGYEMPGPQATPDRNQRRGGRRGANPHPPPEDAAGGSPPAPPPP